MLRGVVEMRQVVLKVGYRAWCCATGVGAGPVEEARYAIWRHGIFVAVCRVLAVIEGWGAVGAIGCDCCRYGRCFGGYIMGTTIEETVGHGVCIWWVRVWGSALLTVLLLCLHDES